MAKILFFHLSAVIESNVPQAYVGRYVGQSGVCEGGGCSCRMRCFSLYGEMRLCSVADVASFPASSEQSTNSVCCCYKGVTADRYRFWYRLQCRRCRYQTDTTSIGPIPIPSTGIGLSLLQTAAGHYFW